ncbi:MAG: carboxypeptidase-like regulatory domain-containing protein [Planctomycetota bacterium]
MRLGPRLLATALGACPANAQDPVQTDVLRGIVVDERGTPVAGLAIDLCRPDGGDFLCLDLGLMRTTRRVATLRTGRNGTFAAQVPRGVRYELRADDGVHAPIVRPEVYGGEELRVLLEAPATIALSLVDGKGEALAGGGEVFAWERSGCERSLGAIDARGRWRSGRLPSGPIMLDVVPATAMRPPWQDLVLRAGTETPLVLAVEPGVVARGRVTDAATGAPIAGARVGEGWTFSKCVLTDDDGRYALHGFGERSYGDLRVAAADHSSGVVRVRAPRADLAQDFSLAPARCVLGRVLGSDGRGVAGVYVAAIAFVNREPGTFDWCSARTDADGFYELRGLRPDIRHTLLVLPPDGARLVADMPSLANGDLVLPDLGLRAGRYVSGRAVDETGAPIVGLMVTLEGSNADRYRLFGAVTGETGADASVAIRHMRTDSLGRIHFASVAPGSYKLVWQDGMQTDFAMIEVTAAGDPEPVSFTVPR